MQRGLAALARPPARRVEVAHALGYAEQAHLTRELLTLAGATPER